MKELKLTTGETALLDDADHAWASQYNWYSVEGYASTTVNGIVLYLHRELLKPTAGLQVDHRDKNKLNNQRSNLRLATDVQNKMNRGCAKTNPTRFKGVKLYPERAKPYMSRINWEKKTIYLGCYTTAEAAAKAYDAKALELYGEFAQLNFPQETVGTSV